MPEVVTVREDLEIIEVRSYGETSKDELARSRKEVSDIMHEQGIRKVLVDARDLTTLPSTFPLFLFGKSFAEADILRTMMMAVVKSKKTTKDVTFIETVARNRGVDMRIFDSMDAAIDWLTA
jgi:hypothetical protein